MESDLDKCDACGGALGWYAMTIQTDAGPCRVHNMECATRWLSARYKEQVDALAAERRHRRHCATAYPACGCALKDFDNAG